MKIAAFSIRFVAYALATVCLAGTSVTVAAPTAARLQEVDAILLHSVKSGDVPGISVAIEQRGKIIYQKGFGFADLENRVAVTPETVFPIGSITKAMTGLAINQLIAQGKVDLDAPVGRYLPHLPAPSRDIPIRYLLDHVSGIVGYTEVKGFPNNTQAPISREEVLGWFASKPLLFEPGTRWSYTNSGFYLLGLVIEAVSGQSYADYLQAHEFVPFDMTKTSIVSWNALIPHRAHGYRHGATGIENAPRYDPLLPFAAGAVLSTSGDLLKYRRGVFGSGPTSAELRQKLLIRDSLQNGFQLPYSLGALVINDFEGHRRIWHPGDIFGFSSQYAYYPDDDLTIVILTNSQNSTVPPTSLERKIIRAVFGIPKPALVDLAVAPALANAVTGEYEVGDMRFGFDRVAFAYDHGTLEMALGGIGAPGIALRYQGGKRFVSSKDDEQTVEFDAEANPPRVSIGFYGSTLTLHRLPR